MRELVRRPSRAVVIRTDSVESIDGEIEERGGVRLQDSDNFHVWLLAGQYLVVVSLEFQIPGTW